MGLFGGGKKDSGSKKSWETQKRRETDRYGKKGTWRKDRGSDTTKRDKDGSFKKKSWFG